MTDLISRQAAVELLYKRLIESANNNVGYVTDAGIVFEDIATERIERWLNELPTIEPFSTSGYVTTSTDEPPVVYAEQKHGKWESNEYLYTTGQTRCSECKTEFYVDDLLNVGEGAQEYLPNYCPNCGARMDL